MNISKEGISLIKKFEGLRLKPYLCSADVPTIGYGSTVYANGVKVTLTDNPITEKEAEELLNKTLKKYIDAVNELVTAPLTQNKFDALVSFVYNVGIENFKRSTLLSRLNNKEVSSAAKEFHRWTKARGVTIQGLVKRRAEEATLFIKG